MFGVVKLAGVVNRKKIEQTVNINVAVSIFGLSYLCTIVV